MKVTRKIIEIDEELCDGCGNCVPSCAEGALQIVDGKAKVVSDNLCDGLGACLGECPTGALRVIEREAEDFDEEAVEKQLHEKKLNTAAEPALACGCPSSTVQILSSPNAISPSSAQNEESTLGHWPVQIKLVPAKAPFLKGADLLVLADCVPVSFPTLHRDFLKGKAVMMGCPKFDDAEEYIDKFAQVFKEAGIKSVTTVIMEVPCCSGLPMIVKKGMDQSGVKVPMEQIVISTKGKIINSIKE
ncbi:MAG: 4Fe-4S binding protein [Proteobacteria bacterium]|nr:4Fe-4S binding protein [Pseudomonadota bacterium]MBU4010076.1 4Fe-4S binding protein [Pseudomonadota bacterium]